MNTHIIPSERSVQPAVIPSARSESRDLYSTASGRVEIPRCARNDKLGSVAGIQCLLVVLLLMLATPARAQTDLPAASPTLAPDHWSITAAKRVEAMGLVEAYLPAQRSVSRAVIGAVLAEAAVAAEERPEWLPLVAGWHARFAEEFPDATSRPSGIAFLGGAAEIGYRITDGVSAPGMGEFPPIRTGALPLDDQSDLVVATEIASAFGSHVAFNGRSVLVGDEVEAEEWEAIVGWGPLALSFGQQRVGYGYGESGGILLTGAVPITRFQLETTRAVLLPSLLRYAGPFALQVFVGEMDEDRHPNDPYIWGGRASIQPHPRFTLTVNRAGFFGGDLSDRPVTFENLVNMLIGRVKGGTFENQMFSAELRYRIPTEEVIPATVYLEWGMEDAAGAIQDVPGRLLGISFPAMPGLPGLATGFEYTFFDESCCSNPEWYRHHGFPGSWSGEEQPLGHPLGGNGSEWLVYANLDAFDSRLRLGGSTFRRVRGPENLYVPGRGGQSLGLTLDLAARVRPETDLTLEWVLEDGDEWTENRFSAGARTFF